MNVEERIEGIAATNGQSLTMRARPKGACRARCGCRAEDVLVDGFFHADPHHGNVIYLAGNRLALIDFGMVAGRPGARRQIVDLLGGLARTMRMMLEVLLEWRGDDVVDEVRLATDLGVFAFDYADMQLKL